jgi:pimeloyl-ACP methyl ester carboxylesterase
MENSMFRNSRTAAVTTAAALCALAGVALTGCDPSAKYDASFSGTGKITVGDRKVNVSCSGKTVKNRPVVVLMSGAGDGLGKFGGIQKSLAEKGKVCSYDRLGEGASDKPAGPQTMESTGKVLTSVIDRVAGDRPVVLVGHSLGGLIAARYAPDHRDRVKGLVLLDATPATMTADLKRIVPASAPANSPGAQARDQFLAVAKGDYPERLAIADAPVRSAGDIPVRVVRHGKQYLAAIPTYGPALERAWADGQRTWLELSAHSTLEVAASSDHYIYLGQPALVVRDVNQVAEEAAGTS